MNSQDLKPEQVRRLDEILQRHLRFHVRLVKRMERLGWPVSDPVYVRAVHARDSVSALKTFVDQIGKNQPLPPATPGSGWYTNSPNVPPGRKRAREV